MMDFGAVASFKELCVEVLDSREAVLFDGGGVLSLTTPCVQVLAAAMAEARANGIDLKIRNPSEAMRNSLAEIGLAEELGDWSEHR